jgi:glycosyltransferase involved in cell wall biosynthesis
MPFARNAATRFISPTKTLEYLAAGCPVVSTPIRDVVSPYGEAGIVRVGEGPSFVEEIRRALGEAGTSAAAARRAAGDAIVARTSWDATWARMEALVERVDRSRLESKRAGARCSTI